MNKFINEYMVTIVAILCISACLFQWGWIIGGTTLYLFGKASEVRN